MKSLFLLVTLVSIYTHSMQKFEGEKSLLISRYTQLKEITHTIQPTTTSPLLTEIPTIESLQKEQHELKSRLHTQANFFADFISLFEKQQNLMEIAETLIKKQDIRIKELEQQNVNHREFLTYLYQQVKTASEK